MDLSLRRSMVGHTHVLAVTGDIDIPSLPRFSDALLRLVTDAPTEDVVIDMDGAGLVEDAALGIVLGAAARARAGGGDVMVVSTEQRLRGRLADTGFDRAVRVTQSISGR
jgi:anti-anti-sigma factor